MSLRLTLTSFALAGLLVACGDAQSQTTAVQAGDQSIQEDSVLQGFDPAAPAASQAALQAGRSRSTLKFEDLEHDLGTVYQFQKYDVEFPFVVDGPDPVVITETDTSCGCTGVDIYPRWEGANQDKPWPMNQPMPAGAHALVVAHFDGQRAVKDKSSTVTIRGNMPEGKIILGLKAFVLPVYEISPSQARFGEMLIGSLREEDPTVVVQVKAMKDFEVLRWKRVPRGVLIKEEGERTTESDTGRILASFRLTATKDLPEGALSSSVIAETSLGVDLEIQAVGVVLGAVNYSPNQRVAFGIFDEGTRKVRSVKIESTLGKVKLPKPTVTLSGDAANAVQAEVKPGVNPDSWEVKLRIGNDVAAGSYNGVLRISYPEDAHLDAKEIVVNARIRPAR